jgi:hypothetical protein
VAVYGFLQPGAAVTTSLSSHAAEFSYVTFRQLRTRRRIGLWQLSARTGRYCCKRSP